MLDSTVQGNLKGDAAFIELTSPKYKVTSMSVGKKYTTGDKGEVSLIDSFLHEYLYVFYGLVAALIVILAMFGYWVLRRYRLKRTAQNQKQQG